MSASGFLRVLLSSWFERFVQLKAGRWLILQVADLDPT